MGTRFRHPFAFFTILSAIVLLATATPAAAQEVVPAPEPRPSPLAMSQLTLDDGTYLNVHYGSPRMRGRDIFGGLVPYGEVWRLGANEATEITVTKKVRFGGKELPAGTYSLFAIPAKDKWTVIVNKNLGQWGAFSYADDADQLRIEVPVQVPTEAYEAFTINLKKNEGEKNGRLEMVWDKTQVTIPIEPGS